MDSDEFDDDIADEDILAALDQVSSSNGGHLASNSSSNGVKSGNTHGPNQRQQAAQELDDLPSDAFSSPEPVRENVRAPPRPGAAARTGFSRTNSGTMRQTTLWGGQAATEDVPRPSQPTTARVFRADLPPEPPSPHELDREAMKTWVYPTNLGPTRDYQFSIVKNSLFNNTLVALPTGLGKTFIAATVMLNFYRWTKSAKIVFVAPTKPLVTQQIDACYHIAGIPRSETTLLTGDIAPALRSDEWEKRRVFFMTPQTLLNDLSHGYADPKSICLMVIDEAHRAVGEYAYAKATKLIRRFSNSFRVLALTATPGSKVETVQEVIDNLGISHCEIRTEESLDIRQYVHQRNIDQIILEPSDEMNLISDLFTEALKPLTEKLTSQNIWYGRNPMALTTYGLIQAQKEWFATRGNRANQGVQFMMRAIFSVLTSLAHSIKLLQFHGIKPFYDNMLDFRSEQEDKGEKGSKYKRQIVDSPSFQEMMDKIAGWLKMDGFVGHPKLTALADCVLNHFMDKGESTRVIVFSEYRDSAEEIVRMFNAHRPLIKATVFVGQADGKRGEGMKQKQQIETIERFKTGAYNVLVATSIGEEGLDIGQVDLIVCYDSSASPIRMLQRMGRTGRKRAGNIALLLMRGKEEEQFAKSKDNYEKMQRLICEGSRFNFRFDLSTRIVPRDIRPEIDMRHVEIPVENTQNTSLPEPKKRQAPRGKKKPPKKFHMPDGVQTGFQKVSDFMKPTTSTGRVASSSKSKPIRNPELDDIAAVPELERVVLGPDELHELERTYRNLPFSRSVVEDVDMPDMTAHSTLQRQLRPTVFFGHGSYTKRCVKLLHKMDSDPDSFVRPCRDADTSDFLEIPVRPFVYSDNGETDASDDQSEAEGKKRAFVDLDSDDDTTMMEFQQPKKRKVAAPRKQPKKTQPKKAPKSAVLDSEDEDLFDSEPDMDAPEEEPGLPPRLSEAKRRKKLNAKSKGKLNRKAAIGSDEIGDDCERDSDLLDESDSDDGADLADFVVGDDQATSSMLDSEATSPIRQAERTPRAEASKPYFVPTQFTATQESEDVPELDTLTGKSAFESWANGGSEEAAPAKRKRRGRATLLDSDDSDKASKKKSSESTGRHDFNTNAVGRDSSSISLVKERKARTAPDFPLPALADRFAFLVVRSAIHAFFLFDSYITEQRPPNEQKQHHGLDQNHHNGKGDLGPQIRGHRVPRPADGRLIHRLDTHPPDPPQPPLLLLRRPRPRLAAVLPPPPRPRPLLPGRRPAVPLLRLLPALRPPPVPLLHLPPRRAVRRRAGIPPPAGDSSLEASQGCVVQGPHGGQLRGPRRFAQRGRPAQRVGAGGCQWRGGQGQRRGRCEGLPCQDRLRCRRICPVRGWALGRWCSPNYPLLLGP